MTDVESDAASIVDRRGIYYQAFDIYNSIGGFYDYGDIGLRIKRNIENAWRNVFVDGLSAFEIETTIVMPEIVFKASGHLSTFTDPIIKCATCNTPYRADKLLEEYYEKKGDRDDMARIRKMSKKEMEDNINENRIKCARCGGKLTGVEDFNLMLKTHVGHKIDDVAYLRPETAQGIFVDFKNLFRIYGMKLPTVISQAGKVYRNEISPRQQLVRLREITQMETELFFDPDAKLENVGTVNMAAVLESKVNFHGSGEKNEHLATISQLLDEGKLPNKYFAMLIYLESKLMEKIGISQDRYKFREIEKEELPHYSLGNVDLEIRTGYGYIEVAGNAYRTDYDLSQHAKTSGSDISVVNDGRKVVPHVVEASVGEDRLVLALLDSNVQNGEDRGWKWLKLNENVAPYRFAVFPLQKDQELIEKARSIHKMLVEKRVSSYYSESGSIGKRYARADEIGVPFAITCDFDTLKDDTVTIRDRDTTKQIRKHIGEIL